MQMVTTKLQNPSDLNNQLYALSTGCFSTVRSYQSCVMNSVRFNTHKRDLTRTTQNSGVAVKGEDTTWYGVLEDIYVVGYADDNSVVLFKCKWFDTSPAKKGVKVYKNRTSICTRNTWYEDEPFILASQAEQVFYIDDLYNGPDWKVVEHFQHRHMLDAPNAAPVVDDVVIDETTHGQFQLHIELPPMEPLYMNTADEAETLDEDTDTDPRHQENVYSSSDEYASTDCDDYDNNFVDDDIYDSIPRNNASDSE